MPILVLSIAHHIASHKEGATKGRESISSLSVAKKLKKHGVKFFRTLNVRHMTAVIDDAESGSLDLPIKALAEAERNQCVFTTPHNERGLVDRSEPIVEDILTANHRVKNLADRVAIAGSYSLFKCKIDIFIEALVVKC